MGKATSVWGSRVGAASCILLGIFALMRTQDVMKHSPAMARQTKLCTGGNATDIAESDLHAYEPMLGGPFVCILTQFMYALTIEPAGILVWGVIATVAFPMSLLMYTEAGRSNARGLVRYPVLILLFSQVMGVSVIFPTMWIPAAVLCQGDGAAIGAPSRGRVLMSMLLALPGLLLQFGVFGLDNTTYAWQVCAGMLGGPLVAFFPLLLWPFPAPKTDIEIAAAPEATRLLAMAYQIFGSLSFLGYMYLVWHATAIFTTPSELLMALWGDKANPAVEFMTVDSSVLSLSFLVYLGTAGPRKDAWLALLASPLVGPGAAISAVLYFREQRRMASGDIGIVGDRMEPLI